MRTSPSLKRASKPRQVASGLEGFAVVAVNCNRTNRTRRAADVTAAATSSERQGAEVVGTGVHEHGRTHGIALKTLVVDGCQGYRVFTCWPPR